MKTPWENKRHIGTEILESTKRGIKDSKEGRTYTLDELIKKDNPYSEQFKEAKRAMREESSRVGSTFDSFAKKEKIADAINKGCWKNITKYLNKKGK